MATTLQPPQQEALRSRSRSKSASGREQLEKIQKHLPPNVSNNITKVTKIVDKLSGSEPRTSAGSYTGTAPPTSYQEYHQQNGMNSNYTYGGSSQSSQLPYNQQQPYGASPQHGGYGSSQQHLQPPPPGAGYGQQPPLSSSQGHLSPNMYTYGTSPSYHHSPSPSPGLPTMSGGASPALPSSPGKPSSGSTTTAKLASKAEKLLEKKLLKSGKKKHGGGSGQYGEGGGENGEGGEYDEGYEDGSGEGDWGGDLAGGIGESVGENLNGGDVGGGDDGSGLGEVLGAIFGG